MSAEETERKAGMRGAGGAGTKTIVQGDCVASIALSTGHFWWTIWDHPDNAALKAERVDPNVLLPGDRLVVPPIRKRVEERPVDQAHRFRRKGVPVYLNVRFALGDQPRAGETYVVTVDGETHTGTLGSEGELRIALIRGSKKALAVIGEGPLQTTIPLLIGSLDPVTEPSGVRGRLNNLGYYASPSAESEHWRTEQAIRAFQVDNDLPVTGEVDAATEAKLQECEGR